MTENYKQKLLRLLQLAKQLKRENRTLSPDDAAELEALREKKRQEDSDTEDGGSDDQSSSDDQIFSQPHYAVSNQPSSQDGDLARRKRERECEEDQQYARLRQEELRRAIEILLADDEVVEVIRKSRKEKKRNRPIQRRNSGLEL